MTDNVSVLNCRHTEIRSLSRCGHDLQGPYTSSLQAPWTFTVDVRFTKNKSRSWVMPLGVLLGLERGDLSP